MSITLQFYSAACIKCRFIASAMQIVTTQASLMDHVEFAHPAEGLRAVIIGEPVKIVQ